jgi:hypothetical protein
MARIVLGVGSSQSPLLSIQAAHWGDYGQTDKARDDRLFRSDGTRVSYQQLEREAGEKFKDIVALPTFNEVFSATQKAIQQLAADIQHARPDLLVVIADDQAELFDRHCIPAVSIYRGAELATKSWDLPAGTADWLKQRYDAASISRERHYPGAPDFADELIARLIDMEIDVAAVSEPTNPEKGIGHAWAFVVNRLLGGRSIPMVPVILNTWYQPNVPTPARCHKLGQALRQAIEQSSRDLRVAVVASGGLSHFVLNEKMDRQVMQALQAGDTDTLLRLPREALCSGSGQILDWIALAGAVEGLNIRWTEYQPGYRTLGGTGTGLAFASWS